MSNGRRTRRVLKKRVASMSPPELISQIQELTDANKALHLMNKAFTEVWQAAHTLLEMRQDDTAYLSVRVALRARLDDCATLKAAIKANKVTGFAPGKGGTNGTVSNGKDAQTDNPTGA
jgi:hypothetical protein